MLKTTIGQLIVNEALPEDLRNYDRVLDAQGVRALMQSVAEKHPDKYRDIVKRLSDFGRDAAYATGGFSFGLKSLRPSPAFAKTKVEIQKEIDQILASDLDDESKQKAVVMAVGRHQKPVEKAIYDEALAEKNPLARQILSGSRGKPMNLKSLRGADLLYVDHHDEMIPIPVLRSYSQGLSPAEYFAGTFGARKGVIDTKMATANAGFFGKQLTQSAHQLIVTALDRDGDGVPDYPRGLPVDTDDADNSGALLGQDVGGYKRNTVLNPRILKDLASNGFKKILVRSPIVGGPGDGGIYGRDAGVRERGGISPLGDQVGIAAAQAIGEPISQGGLSSKHSGGVAGAGRTVGGFKALNQLVQVPKAYPGGAAHSEKDGRVQSIIDAPAGGKYVVIGGENHYVPNGFAIHVNVGDEVEAGDALSEGLPNPAKVVQHKGIGEGRRYFVKVFRDAMKDAGLSVDRRNLEVVSRGLVNHVRLTEEIGEHVPDDVVPYDRLENAWQPRPGSRTVTSSSAAGKYLESPALHYTIGTKLNKRMLQEMADFGVKQLQVHDDPPPFEPEMIRGMENLQHDPDWMVRQLGSNLQKTLLAGTARGAVSDAHGTSFVPALANPVDFGRKGLVRGFDPKSIVKPPVVPEPKPVGGSVLDGL